jgi:hypothetical protein
MSSNSASGSSNAIEQYRQAKSDYLRLRNQAKKELIARFHQAANELFQIQRELLEDFGEKIAIPSKAKKSRPVKGVKAPERKTTTAQTAKSPQTAGPAVISPQVASLQQQLQKARKKLTDTQAAGKPTKAAEDRIYELEDAIRLAQAK